MRGFSFARDLRDGKVVSDKAYPDARLPKYATRGSAACDFYCAEDVVVPSVWKSCVEWLRMQLNYNREALGATLKPTLVHTGIKASMGSDEVLEVYNRSGNPLKLGLLLSNGVGVIDSDYYENKSNDGEIMFAFWNFSFKDVEIKVGDRIGQGMFKTVLRPSYGVEYSDDYREGGHGSTGFSEKGV